MTVALIAVTAIAVMLVATYISLYNDIVHKDDRCDDEWQAIDAQLQRRNDLIPSLVETVGTHAQQERQALVGIVKACSAVAEATTPADKMSASNELSGALGHLLASAETYPDLESNADFQHLRVVLTDTEGKIGHACMSYNDCVLDYNNAIATFPGSVIAGSKFRRREGFEVTNQTAREAPRVRF